MKRCKALLPIWLRREPTRDKTLARYGIQQRRPFDVCIYRDAAATQFAGYWGWEDRTKPRPGRKTVVFNCYKWEAHWLPDLEEETVMSKVNINVHASTVAVSRNALEACAIKAALDKNPKAKKAFEDAREDLGAAAVTALSDQPDARPFHFTFAALARLARVMGEYSATHKYGGSQNAGGEMHEDAVLVKRLREYRDSFERKA